MGAGIACLGISSTIHGPLVTADWVDAAVARYNDRLKADIEDQTRIGDPKPNQARLQLTVPFVGGRSGGGLLAVARF